MEPLWYAILGLAGAALAVAWGLLLWTARRASRTEAELRETLRWLGEQGSRGHAELTARLERVKGELQADLGDRFERSLGEARELVEQELARARMEQGARLHQTAESLMQRFVELREATEARLEKLTEAQGRALSETTQLLERRLEALERRSAQEAEQLRGQVQTRLEAIQESVREKLERNLREGFAHFQKVQDHLKAAEDQLREVSSVGQSVQELNALLKLPHLRGQFGEAQLSRLLADFLPVHAYAEQYIIAPGSREAVDAVVKFPGRLLPIDSKFNREQILPLFESGDPEHIKEARERLAQVVKQQARQIAEKYIHPEHGTTELALMFLPSETIYFEVIRDARLCEALRKTKVFPVSPNTLAVTLHTVAMSLSHYEFAKGVEKTLRQLRLAKQSFDHFQKRFEEVGKGLQKAQEAYQTASGHLSRYAGRVERLAAEGVEESPLEEGRERPQLPES
ncbi:MAG: DNA recombination protein RmuC [Verrucomicrobia bacterium]|nr:DNA recombination protein RmuC [Verrucomicrobiota bacterium]